MYYNNRTNNSAMGYMVVDLTGDSYAATTYAHTDRTLSATIVWQDNGNHDSKRPETLNVLLTKTAGSWTERVTYTLSALTSRDYPVVQGSVLFFTIMFSFILVLVDMVFALVAPRIKSQFSGQSRRKKQSLPDTKAAEKDSEAVMK